LLSVLSGNLYPHHPTKPLLVQVEEVEQFINLDLSALIQLSMTSTMHKTALAWSPSFKFDPIN
jgi:hypothetical protein